MKVGFLNNQVDNRGTGNALFDYAHYNEEILGNESVILSLDTQYRDQQMEKRLIKRFELIYSFAQPSYVPQDLDVLYHIKSGAQDGFLPPKGVRYVVHGVFECPNHGDRSAVVSRWLAARCHSDYVPHIIDLPMVTSDLRSHLEIPQDAIVFGRHGGLDSFDIPWVWSAINRALKAKDNVWFLLMNTAHPTGITFHDPKRVVFIDPTADPRQKMMFINSCDAMLHARGRGETFGIAVGEFASQGIPILTYGLSPERNHLEEIACHMYHSEDELVTYLIDNEWTWMDEAVVGYTQYTPKNVMKKFKEVFLD